MGAERQCARMHHVRDAREQLAAQAATGVEPGEVFRLESARGGQHHRQGIAHCDGGGGGTGGRQIVVACLVRRRDVERDVGIACQRRGGLARHGNNEVLLILQKGQKADKFFRFAAIGNHERHIDRPDHSQVPVKGLAGMHGE
ncbi:hypothetical protein D3C71_1638500 [compost metagenome]